MDTSGSSLVDRVVLVRCSGVVTQDDLPDIRWYFEDPRVGGKLVQDEVRFIGERRFIMELVDIGSCDRILTKSQHNVKIGSSLVEMTVERCPPGVARQYLTGASSLTTDMDDESSFMIISDHFDQGTSQRFDIIPDDFKYSRAEDTDCEPPEDHTEENIADFMDSSTLASDPNLSSSATATSATTTCSAEGRGIRRPSSADADGTHVTKRIKREESDPVLNAEPVPNNEKTFTGVSSSPVPDSASPDARARTIQVLDVPTNDFEILELYLESTKNGGGDVDFFSHDKENHYSVVTFADEKVAQHFLTIGSICINGNTLLITPLPEVEEKQQPMKEEEAQCISPVAVTTIQVKGVKPNHTASILQLYFENRKRSDGGAILEMKVYPEEERAVITFQDEEVAKRVLDHGPHKLLGVSLECEAVDCGSDTSDLYSIEVSGFTEKISEEMLLFFFENRKRSGGGEVEEMFYSTKDQRCVITFKSPDVVERVLQNHRNAPLTMNDVRLSVSALRPAPISPRLIGEAESDKLLVTNIPEDASTDDLRRYIQRGSGALVTKLRYSMKPGVAMIQFQDTFDYHRLKDLIRSRPFQGVMLAIQRVPVPCSIQIFDSGKLTVDHLMLYFENPKSGGDEVVSCDSHSEEDYVVLTFADKNVVPNVLSREHEIEGQRLKVSIFYEGLGAMPPDVDDEKPTWWFPPDFAFACDSRRLAFVQNCSKLRTHIESALEAEYCKVEWPTLPKIEGPSVPCSITLHCTLTRRTKNVGQLAKTWASSCRDRMGKELEDILVKDINVLQELWKTVLQRMSSIDEKISTDEVFVLRDNDACTIRIVGIRKSSERFVGCVLDLVSKAEEELQREKCKISEQIPKLKLFQLELLKLGGLLDATSGDNGVEVVTKGTDVELIGQPSDIIAKKLVIFECLNSITSESVDLPGFVIDSLKLQPFRNHISQCLKDKGVVSAWNVGPKGLTVYALNPDEVNRTSVVMNSEIMQRSLELDAAQAATLTLPAWATLKTTVTNSLGVFVLKEEASRLTVTAIGSNMNAIIEEIHNFIKENAIKEEFFMTKRGTAFVVSQYLKGELKSACDDLKSCHMSIREELSTDRTGFVISITEHGVRAALNKVTEISNKVLEKEKVLDRPGMSNYLHSTRGKKQIEVIQSMHQVFIEEWEEANQSSYKKFEARKRRLHTSVDEDVEPKVLIKKQLHGSAEVRIVLGDITSYKVDAIVNAANGQLDHIGGVARNIADRGGPEIQSECKAYIRQNGSMIAGNFYVSKPGTLPCKYIIHAVGPMWQNGLKNEANVLYETVYNVLAESERLSLTSVAMPAISTGVFGFPLRKAVKTILEAVEEFIEYENLSSLKVIHIIDNNRGVIAEFQDMFRVKFLGEKSTRSKDPIVIDDDNDTFDAMSSRSFKVPKSSSDSSRLMTRSLSTTYSFPSTSTSSSTSSAASSSSFVQNSPASSGVSGSVLTTPQGLCVTLVKGSIVQQKVDVIVNTTSQTLVLSNGAVSSLILQTAGPSIQVECQQNAPGGATSGKVVVTSGYNLPCSEVYHGFCLSWDNAAGPCEKSVRDLLKAIFREANTTGWRSVAIPAIGTGNLKIPAGIVARIMYEEAEEFSRANPMTALNDVRFVVYDKDQPTISAFEQELHFPSRGQKSKGKKSEERILANKGKNPNEPKTSGPEGGWSISINEVKLEVTQGDITESTTDAIVNSTNEDLNLRLGAVSAAILKAGGPRILDECNRIGKMTDGMAITRAGDLAAKYIFHLKAHSTERSWKKAIENCLVEADRRSLTSITFPLLGTGNINAPVHMMASVMLDAVMNFSTKSNPQHLSLIRIAIFQPHMVEQFAKAIDDKAREHQSSGIFNRFKVYMKSVFGMSAETPKSFDVQEIPRFRKFDERVRFTIYGLTEKEIDSAILDMEDLCSDIIQDKIIEKDSIAKLSDEQIARIHSLEQEFSVKITVDRGHRLNRIRIQGEGQAIVSVLDKIYAIFAEVEEQQREEYHAEIIAQQAQWMYQFDDSYDPYPKPINLIIEKAYQSQVPFAEWDEEDGLYRLDFQRMEEMKNKDGKSVVKVKRMTAESQIPKSWDTMNTDELCKRVVLSANSQEYQDVLKHVRLTDGGLVRQVISIERIQNPSLYQQYVVRREAMQRLQQGTSTCERILWHGTSADTLESINFHGFNRSYCGKNAVVYGKGVYFANGFQYSGSNTYAVPDPMNGYKHVYQSRVLTGEFVVGNQNCIVPPAKPGGSAIRYDSVVDNPAAPSIFVIFSDTQAYPEYLIIFK